MTDWHKVNIHTPYDSFVLKVKQEREINAWCQQHFPHGNYHVGTRTAFFKNERDAVYFSLMWS